MPENFHPEAEEQLRRICREQAETIRELEAEIRRLKRKPRKAKLAEVRPMKRRAKG